MSDIQIKRGTTQELKVTLKDRPGDFGLPIPGTNWGLEILGAGWGDVVYAAPTTQDRGIGRRAALVTFDFPSGENYLIRWTVTDPSGAVRQLTTDFDIVSPIGRSESTWDLTAAEANALVPDETRISDSILRAAVLWVERKIPYHPSEIPLLKFCLDGSPNPMGLRDLENIQLGIAYRASALCDAGVEGDGSEGAESGGQIVTVLDDFKARGYLVSSLQQSAGSIGIGIAVPSNGQRVQAVEVDEDNEKTRIAVEWLQRLSRYRQRPHTLRLGGGPTEAPQPIRGFSRANGKVLKPYYG